jgi:hypothetical protein
MRREGGGTKGMRRGEEGYKGRWRDKGKGGGKREEREGKGPKG